MNTSANHEKSYQSGWIALYTKANRENMAIANIKRQGYDAYCPMVERTIKHARKTEHVLRPLFPSYVFAHLNDQKLQWRSLDSTIGVNGVVRFNDKLGLMPEGFVERLRDYELSNQLSKMVSPTIEPGMNVKILEGHFENRIANVIAMPEKGRVWLLMEILGRQTRIQHEIWSLASC